jgi:hypothetical protein
MQREAQEFAYIFEPAAISLDQRGDIEADCDDQVGHQHPPRDALACGEGSGHHGDRERPRETGVGKVEQIIVDEFPGCPGEVPDRRRDAGQQ